MSDVDREALHSEMTGGSEENWAECLRSDDPYCWADPDAVVDWILASDWLAQVKATARAEGEAETREQVAQEIEAVAAMGVHAYEEPCFVDAALVARGRWQR